MPHYLIALRPDELRRLFNPHTTCRFAFHVFRKGMEYLIPRYIPDSHHDRAAAIEIIAEIGSRFSQLEHFAHPEPLATPCVKLIMAGITIAKLDGTEPYLVPLDMTNETMTTMCPGYLLDFLARIVTVAVHCIKEIPHVQPRAIECANIALDEINSAATSIATMIATRIIAAQRTDPGRRIASVQLHLEILPHL